MSSSPLNRIKEALREDFTRTRLVALIFIMGIIVGLPHPFFYAQNHERGLILFLWFSLLLLAWMLWTSSYYLKLVWLLGFIASLLAWWKLDLFLPCVMMVVWAFWYSIRFARLQKTPSK